MASELYRDIPIDLQPQMGLVPIGMNPVTRLWEFYHLRSAWDPASGLDPADLPIPEHADDGSIRMEPGTGIVFVLIPGGTYWMGAQKEDPGAPNFDPQAQLAESSVLEVTLDPYFLARHELTRGQWFRLSHGEKPGWFQQGRSSYEVAEDAAAIGWTRPVESVSWEMCNELFFRHGLLLPTEAQWERGARGGTPTPWWTGTEASSLEGAANVFDRKSESVVPDWGQQEGDFDDGFVMISPVGSFRANLFGLFDVHGNAWEWCRDRYGPFSIPPRPGDGLRIDDLTRSNERKRRGGSFYHPARYARSSFWARSPPSLRDFSVGVRPARELSH
ncbi:MAG: formylglycine-generating enzyme family protein [Planctomycetota bacterium]